VQNNLPIFFVQMYQSIKVWKFAGIAEVGGMQIGWNHTRKFVKVH
jgi:hypothetical protein